MKVWILFHNVKCKDGAIGLCQEVDFQCVPPIGSHLWFRTEDETYPEGVIEGLEGKVQSVSWKRGKWRCLLTPRFSLEDLTVYEAMEWLPEWVEHITGGKSFT